jgi:hypothetical protein
MMGSALGTTWAFSKMSAVAGFIILFGLLTLIYPIRAIGIKRLSWGVGILVIGVVLANVVAPKVKRTGDSVSAAKEGPAPKGNPGAIAWQVISTNFDRSVCPGVINAMRLDDGWVAAKCHSGETFLVGMLGNEPIAMRCSAAKNLGVEGCDMFAPKKYQPEPELAVSMRRLGYDLKDAAKNLEGYSFERSYQQAERRIKREMGKAGRDWARQESTSRVEYVPDPHWEQ